jgi:hypothetical protein
MKRTVFWNVMQHSHKFTDVLGGLSVSVFRWIEAVYASETSVDTAYAVSHHRN